MPIIGADFTGVETTPQPLPVGSYSARIVELKEGTSKTGNPKLDVVYEITHQGFEGRKAFRSLSLQSNALFSFKRLLLATGEWDEDDLKGPMQIDTAEIVGLEVCVVVVANSYKKDGQTVFNTSVDRDIPVSEAEGPSSGVSDAARDEVEGEVGAIFGSR